MENLARLSLSALLWLVGPAAALAGDAPAARPFDGNWHTRISCPNVQGALGFSYEFATVVKDSVLHGEKGVAGQPGWLSLDGPIGADGHARLYANGLVGASAYTVGGIPAGTAYGYHVEATFSASTGSGRRVEGRACEVQFERLP